MKNIHPEPKEKGHSEPKAGPAQRSGIVAIVGRANTGKSTLMNRVLDEKISIVSHVAQTTRNLIRGVFTDSRGQLVLLDTPGLHKATTDLGRLMNKTARISVEGADAALLVLDASEPPSDEDVGWMTRLAKIGLPCILLLNKTDIPLPHRPAYETAWAATRAANPTAAAGEWFSVSAQTGDGVEALVARLFSLLPEGPLLFPEEMLTDFPRKWNIADTIREKFFLRLRNEVPHSIGIVVEKLSEREADWGVDVTIHINRASQRPILLGRKGRLLREVQEKSEAELSAMYNTKVRLYLWIKVQKDWAKNPWLLKQMGYI